MPVKQTIPYDSSAKFYLAGEQGKYEVNNVSEMQDMEFERKAN